MGVGVAAECVLQLCVCGQDATGYSREGEGGSKSEVPVVVFWVYEKFKYTHKNS